MKTYKLDDLKAMAALDKSGCLLSLKYFSKQLKAAWGQANQLILPEMPLPSRVLFCAMGGSAYAGRIIKDLYSDEAEVSFEVIDDYDLPKYADDRTLIIAASYSGNTEETLSTFSQALARKIPLILVCGGGTLEKFGKQNNLPTYVFDGEFNPSKQPRLGQGYMIASQLAILAKMGLLKLSSGDFLKALDFLEEKNKLYPEHIPQAANPAKQIASQLEYTVAVLVAGDFLKGALHPVRNPLNETAKHFADYFVLPELNHHLLEGLQFPKEVAKTHKFVFINSTFYRNKIKLRLNLTETVVAKNGLTSQIINLSGGSKITQVLELLQLFGFISFYLAILHRVNPSPVPFVDFFKQKLNVKEDTS
ncbi:hypothetical protein A3J20_07245 [Candidatus Gottesmanbacteria bacterium RIFCSPLOWO2_02_FULL_42_29]|uniref:SIS domain-containing protein n=2 Tax=Candidatus Gottesmaniibacteriota TaxID=1752720 RepID=A0A1F6B937_9BACT|nr:MAG: Bifunctional phosphoglucose/phosphomannose isomerase [Candidatus Gottesmanbacteria bacterium GW2011_GWA2_42_18]KKS74487.1 MAG: Bifunctional phosphoglucose/phosphomannose isomerase [Candidatus Gottesmanbacteria bacterium GW2011_GWC2_42_8]OGG10050.1 MAG: hypothetical protein A2781_01695 [Candidatus Gottesmanbacteria bacterium RIFCSPHIGHO2_01_FULL_42_27]OGG20309.1 MAG: hypothetical protein A3E72_04245 [Candidatus Gottesmanbacteria bacterium RIFCSPHIGHO2_12_FULL_43_26]OGG33446.1 MAG: hypoth